jgi:single-stranded-DNA-specific exonuclease
VGIKRLQQQLTNPTRPGVAKLLELCQKTGDRPTDISFGLGPRINAVSRIQGEAEFCVELLTSRDPQRCYQLALATELANTRRQSLQRDVFLQVKDQLMGLDLSTTSVIVLADSQWQVGILGLVASQIAREYGRPTILLSTGDLECSAKGESTSQQEPLLPDEILQLPTPPTQMARGSARSIEGIDLYQLVKSQSHLLDRFGGHPLAAGLSLSAENLPLFIEGINRQLSQRIEAENLPLGQVILADLKVTVSELGQDLFRELKLIEPCGMGNPSPKFLIKNCWFDRVFNRNLKDSQGRTIKFIKTEFEIGDDSSKTGFMGVWWGHYQEEIPPGRCDAIVELDYNVYHRRYEVRLLAVRSSRGREEPIASDLSGQKILDWRHGVVDDSNRPRDVSILEQCPRSWEELQQWIRHGEDCDAIALGYALPESPSPERIWRQSIGIAKYLSRTKTSVTRQKLCEKLGIGDRALSKGILAWQKVGFKVIEFEESLLFERNDNNVTMPVTTDINPSISQFLMTIREEQFHRQYFSQVPVSIVRSMTNPFGNSDL